MKPTKEFIQAVLNIMTPCNDEYMDVSCPSNCGIATEEEIYDTCYINENEGHFENCAYCWIYYMRKYVRGGD